MSAGILDDLARRLARGDSAGATSETLTRSQVIGRGLLGALALGSLGRLAMPGRASGQTQGCTSLAQCLIHKERFWENTLVTCDHNHPSLFGQVDCFRDYREGLRGGHQYCVQECPPPPGRPPKKKPKRKATSAPPLPPNPYDKYVDECANCSTVGGHCCYGGADPSHLCACATAGISCTRYGCKG